MNNRKLIITWKPSISTMYLGTSRSEIDSFNNVHTLEAAQRIVNTRNKNEIISAKWNGVVIYSKSIK